MEVDSDFASGLCHALVGLQVHLLVLQAPPQPLDENVVQPAALAVHRDRYTVVFENAGDEGFGGELGALVGVEDLRSAVGEEGLLEGLDAEVALHRVREPPREHAPAVPVDYSDQIQKTFFHWDEGNIGRADLPRAVDGKAPPAIRILLVGRARRRGTRLRM